MKKNNFVNDTFEKIIDDFPNTPLDVLVNRLINVFNKLDHDITYYRNLSEFTITNFNRLEKK
jgi:hypothetical protein